MDATRNDPVLRAPAALRDAIEQLEAGPALDGPGEQLAPIASRLNEGRRGEILRGEWLGHALHPLLTDLPLGCWIGASVLDLTAGPSSRKAARRLVGIGLLATPITAASGLADWGTVDDPRARRVGVAHALGNSAVAMSYLLSWRARRKGHHLRGTVFALVGGVGAIVTGYLGGHLSFARGAGQGERGLTGPAERGADEPGGRPAPGAADATSAEVDDRSQFPAASF